MNTLRTGLMRKLIAGFAFLAVAGLIAWAVRGEMQEPAPVVVAQASPAELPAELDVAPVVEPQPQYVVQIAQTPRTQAVEPPKPKRPVISGKVPTVAEEQEPAAILKRASTAYTNMKSMSANFVQRRENPLLGTTITSRGLLFQRRPDRFLLRFVQPEGDVIVSDGRFFWLYYPSVDAKQVLRSPVSKQGAGAVDLQAQFIGDPATRFQHKYEGRETFGGRSTYVMTLTPRAKDAGYKTLKVWIDAGDNLVRRFQITEQTGAVMEFLLTNLIVNPALGDEMFRFKPPTGARVIDR